MPRVCLTYILFGLLIKLSDGYYFERDDGHLNLDKLQASLGLLFQDSNVAKSRAICCADGQWEAHAYVNAGTKLFNEFGTIILYHNGTVKIAFDEVNKKSYVNFNVTQFEPGALRQEHMETTVIKDFTTGMTYEIDDGKCSKRHNFDSLQIVCVPEKAKKISTGLFGGKDVKTFQFSSISPPLRIVTTPTIRQNGTYCEPIKVSYGMFFAGGLQEYLYGLDIVDFTRGIQDSSIFVPPKSCG